MKSKDWKKRITIETVYGDDCVEAVHIDGEQVVNKRTVIEFIESILAEQEEELTDRLNVIISRMNSYITGLKGYAEKGSSEYLLLKKIEKHYNNEFAGKLYRDIEDEKENDST